MRRPNVVLVSSDQQRYDAVGCNGNSFVRTPNADRLAREGVRFSQARAPWPVCTPCRATLWTGVLPHRHGIVTNTYGEASLLERAEGVESTLFDCARRAGYRTGYVGKWHLGEDDPGLFDAWHGFNSAGGHWEGGVVDGRYKPFEQTDRTVELIERWSTAGERPFLLVLSLYPPHQPYSAPRALMERYRAMGVPFPGYYAGVDAVDLCLGRVLDAVDEAGIADRTVVAFFSDHGETFNYRRESRNKFVCHEESVRVPLVLRWPSRWPAGRVVDELVGLEDLFPTLLAVIGADPPAHALHGRDLGPLLEGGAAPPDWRREYFLQNVTFGGLDGLRVVPGRVQRCLIADGWKLIVSDGGGGELYDLTADPEEEMDLYLTPRRDPHGRFAHLPSQAARILELAERMAKAATVVGDTVGIALARRAVRDARARLPT